MRDRIFAEADQSARSTLTRLLLYVCDRSELALPRIAADRNRFDVGLIDGSHNWPSVFVDFCYINTMLPAGGTLFVDDIHLYSVSQLFRSPSTAGGVRTTSPSTTRWRPFRKLVDRPFLA